jgi:hypothetical protein
VYICISQTFAQRIAVQERDVAGQLHGQRLDVLVRDDCVAVVQDQVHCGGPGPDVDRRPDVHPELPKGLVQHMACGTEITCF